MISTEAPARPVQVRRTDVGASGSRRGSDEFSLWRLAHPLAVQRGMLPDSRPFADRFKSEEQLEMERRERRALNRATVAANVETTPGLLSSMMATAAAYVVAASCFVVLLDASTQSLPPLTAEYRLLHHYPRRLHRQLRPGLRLAPVGIRDPLNHHPARVLPKAVARRRLQNQNHHHRHRRRRHPQG